MPWIIRERDGRHCVYKEGADGEPAGDALACHDTREQAEAQRRALYANAGPEASKSLPLPGPEPDESVAFDGGEVKALGGGRVGGYLVRFGDPESADIQGEFFDASCYFGKARHLDILYDHGMPMRRGGYWPAFRNRPIGEGEVKSLGDGLWFEGHLDLGKPRVADLYADVEAGRMGWSSGSTERLVIREPVKSRTGRLVKKILQWPLNEATLSPRPVDPNNRAYALKALPESELAEEAGAVAVPCASPSLVDALAKLVADAEGLLGPATKAVDIRLAEGRNVSQPKLDGLRAAGDALLALHSRCLDPGPASIAVPADDLDLDLEIALLGAYEATMRR